MFPSTFRSCTEWSRVQGVESHDGQSLNGQPGATAKPMNRRLWLKGILSGAGACNSLLQRSLFGKERSSDLIDRIDRQVIWNGRSGGNTWFHPRACLVPGGAYPSVLMTCQTITGSDVFSQVHWSVTHDNGRSWSPPQPIPSLGRQTISGLLEEGTCDVVPEFHPNSDSVLAIGHNVYYENDVLTRPYQGRYTVYVVRRGDGEWSERKRLRWDSPMATGIYSAGCAQRINLDGGEILLPISFGPLDRPHRSVCTLLCSFDGVTLKVLKTGNELNLAVNRGLLEPSLASFQGRYFMTIRAEDGHGYVSASTDGLNWQEKRPWTWDDGRPLVMSTTQQRWMSHSDGLFLVYTREAGNNRNVMRWRAPLFLARFDAEQLCLIRDSERVVFPLVGDGIDNAKHVARMGNFHVVNASALETWVTVGETLPHDGWKGDTLLARIHWRIPNRLVRVGRGSSL